MYTIRFHTSSSLARPSASGGTLSLPLRMMVNRFSSAIAFSVFGLVQSASFSPMPLARSVLPFPLSPWHIAQSIEYSFLAFACDSTVGFTGFFEGAAAGAGVASWARGLGMGAGENTNRINAVRSIIGFNIAASSDVGAEKLGAAQVEIFCRPNYSYFRGQLLNLTFWSGAETQGVGQFRFEMEPLSRC